MAFYLLGSYIREQRERLGVTQEELCEGICSTATLSKIENGHQSVRMGEYIALMQRLGLPMQPMGIHVTEDEMRWYNLKREISYKVSSFDWNVEDLLKQFEECSFGMKKMTEQYVTYVRAGIKKSLLHDYDEVLGLLLHAIHCTYPRFDIDNVNSVKLLTFDEIMIIDCIASVLKKQGKITRAIMWGYYLKDYLEKNDADYDEVTKAYPLVLFNLSNWLMECKRYEEAEKLCSSGIEYCNRHGKLNIFMELLYNKGICRAEAGDAENAAKYMTYAYIIAEARGDEQSTDIIKGTFSEYGIKPITL
ncbi:MAG: helix-turn-helix domain-containing protein [Lachnospiraceae bacterium]